MTEPAKSKTDPNGRSRAIGNTIMMSIFFILAVAVTLTRATWWGTALMAVISLWALGMLVANAMAIKEGLPPLERYQPPPDDSSK